MTITTGNAVYVNTERTWKRGIVRYVSSGGFVAVQLIGERRVDEWHPSLVVVA